MAGFLADARQWRKFEKRTTKLFSRFRVGGVIDALGIWSGDFRSDTGYAAILLEKDYQYYLSLNANLS
jgi:hypothetical protein